MRVSLFSNAQLCPAGEGILIARLGVVDEGLLRARMGLVDEGLGIGVMRFDVIKFFVWGFSHSSVR